MELRFHSHLSAGGTASIYASSCGAKEAERVIEYLALLKKWLQQDQYEKRYNEFRRLEWRGMTAG